MAKPFFYVTDAKNRVYVHLYEDWELATPPAVPYHGKIITASAAELWQDANDSNSALWQVEFNIVNQSATDAVIVTIALDPLGGTANASPDIIYNATSIAAKAESGWKGPYVIPGSTSVTGVADATNRAAIFFRVLKLQALPAGTA